MNEKFQNKYRIDSTRAKWWDYSKSGMYFITICTAGRRHYFGKIENGVMKLTEIGGKAQECWMEIPNHFKYAKLDEFVVMPDHFHGIIIIDQPFQSKSSSPALICQKNHPRFRNQGKNTISAMVGSFKSAVTKWCNENNFQFGWQTRFHDHIIQNDLEYYRIRKYIINNPAKWKMG